MGEDGFCYIFYSFFFVDSNNWLGWVEMMGPKLVTVYVDGLKLMFMLGNVLYHIRKSLFFWLDVGMLGVDMFLTLLWD